MTPAATDPQLFRKVLGQLPTGVCVVTATQSDGLPIGMTVGSFTSVSLDPPLVAFFPDRRSSSWSKIDAAGRFCVNILSADQELVCRQLASKAANKFEGLCYRQAPSGAPILAGVVAWIDCDLHSVQVAGDHYIVLGAVRAMEIETAALPLVFFQGGYGRFSPLSIGVPDPSGALSEQLRIVDRARPEMDRLCRELSAGSVAAIRVEDELMVAACAGLAERTAVSALVGQHLPFTPPAGSIFAAWTGESSIEEWIGRSGCDPAELRATLEVIRRRGCSLGMISPSLRASVPTVTALSDRHPASPPVELRDLIPQLVFDPAELTPEIEKAVQMVSAPVFDSNGHVALVLTLFDFPSSFRAQRLGDYVEALLAAADRVTERVGGHRPNSVGPMPSRRCP